MDSNGGIVSEGKTSHTKEAYLNRGKLLWKRASVESGTYLEKAIAI